MKLKYNNIREYLICCLIGIVPKIVMILTASYPLRVPGDELFLFSIPANFAGLDWTSCMTNYRYYGYGFSIFLIPLFKYIQNPLVLYRSILIIVAIMQLTIPIICCYLLIHFFGVKRNIYVIIITTICTYSVAVYNTYMYNEHIYIIWIWISFLILAKLWNTNTKKKKMIYSFFLGVSFVGALTVHQRAVTLFLAFFVMDVFMILVLKKRIGYIIPVMITYLVGNCINTKLMYYFINTIKYDNNVENMDLSNIQNTGTDMMNISWKKFQDKEYLWAVGKTFLGNINNLNVFTVGILVFSLVLGIYFLVLLYRNKNLDEEQKRLLCFGVFGMAAVLITIAGLANTWGWGIRNAYVNNNASSRSLRGLRYLRYPFAYYPPIMLGVLGYIYKHQDEYIKLFRYTISLSGILIFYYLAEIMPLMKNTSESFGELRIYNPHAYLPGNSISIDYFIAAIFFWVMMIGLYILIKNKKSMVAYCLICMLIGWRYIYQTYLGDGVILKQNYQCADCSHEIIMELEKNNINIPIYISEKDFNRLSYICEVQFMNMQTRLFRGMPEEELTEVIYITVYPREAEMLLEDGYKCFRLDEEEYMYVKGEGIAKFVQKYAQND